MSDIVERLRDRQWVPIIKEASDSIEARDAEIERLRAELATSKETQRRFAASYSRLGVEERDAEIERLRAENFALAAGQCVNAVGDEGGTPICKELGALKALLREALVHLDDTWGAGELCNTIRAELGDEPADDAPRKQP